jgi:hypothetical protein
MQGRSLVEYLRGGEMVEREGIVTEFDDEHMGIFARTLTTKDWRLTRYAGKAYGELFDRSRDPNELQNLWNDAQYRQVRRELTLLLLDEVMLNAPLREPRTAIYA